MGLMEIRNGLPGDVPALQRIFRDASLSNEGDRALFAEHPELLEWADTPLREGRTRVATDNGRLVGFHSLLVTNGVVELEDLFVDPGDMGRGVGRALTDDAAAQAREQGFRALEVDANPHAKAFYAKAGFEDLGVIPVAFGTGFRMRRVL